MRVCCYSLCGVMVMAICLPYLKRNIANLSLNLVLAETTQNQKDRIRLGLYRNMIVLLDVTYTCYNSRIDKFWNPNRSGDYVVAIVRTCMRLTPPPPPKKKKKKKLQTKCTCRNLRYHLAFIVDLQYIEHFHSDSKEGT